MPLCTGVRPWHEDMPSKDKGEHVELYTSNTTAPILSILRRISAEPEVARDDLENSLMRRKVLTAHQRKQLLNAVYGNEPDENDIRDKRIGFTGKNADKDRFFHQHLGGKVTRNWIPGKAIKKGAGIHYENEGNKKAFIYANVEKYDSEATHIFGQDPASLKEHTPAWMGAELRQVGSFDPVTPDKRGKWKMLPLEGIDLRDASEIQPKLWRTATDELFSPMSPISPTKKASGAINKASGEAVKKNTRIDQVMMDLKIRPSQAMASIRDVLLVVFDSGSIHIDKFKLSFGELVGLARHGESFHIPHHTKEEQQCTKALQELCAKHLDLLLKSQCVDDFDGMASVPNWKKEHCDLMIRVMQCVPAWQSGAVQSFWNINRKMMELRGEIEVKHKPYTGGNRRHTSDAVIGKAQLISNNAEYMELEHSVRANKLDLEWYERLFVLQKRDRQYLRAELELYFEQIILVKKHREDNTSDEQIAKNIAAPAALEGRQTLTNESYEKKADDRAHGYDTVAVASTHTHTDTQTHTLAASTQRPATVAMSINAAPAADYYGRKPKPLEGISRSELVDSPRYWLDDRLASADVQVFDDTLTLKQIHALNRIMDDPEDFQVCASAKEKEQIAKGKKSENVATAKMLAYKMLHMKRGNMSAMNSLSFVKAVQQISGIVPGRIIDEDGLAGASRGSCFYRLLPSFEQHDKQPTHHPTRRPISGKIENITQLTEIQRILKHPSVDGKGKSLKFNPPPPVGIHRPPTATPKRLRTKKVAAAMQHSGWDRLKTQSANVSATGAVLALVTQTAKKSLRSGRTSYSSSEEYSDEEEDAKTRTETITADTTTRPASTPHQPTLDLNLSNLPRRKDAEKMEIEDEGEENQWNGDENENVAGWAEEPSMSRSISREELDIRPATPPNPLQSFDDTDS